MIIALLLEGVTWAFEKVPSKYFKVYPAPELFQNTI